MAVRPSTERPWGFKRSDSICSDAFDNQTAVELVIQRISDTVRTRVATGSTDEKIDRKYWAREITDIFMRHPVEAVPVAEEEKSSSPVVENPGGEEGPGKNAPKKKKIQGVDVEALKKRCKMLQEKLKDEKAAREELQKAKDTVVSEYEKLMVDEKVRKEETGGEDMEEEDAMDELEKLREEFEAERTRADKMEEERDEIRNTIAEKRREFEVEKMDFEAMQKELELYRYAWGDPAILTLLECKTKLASQWEEDAEEEERIVEEMLESQSLVSNTRKGPSQNQHIYNTEPDRENLKRRIKEQDAELSLLKHRLAKAEAERNPNPDKAVLDLSSHIDEILRGLRIVYREASTADIARNDALEQVRRLEIKTRAAGSHHGSAFSVRTPASATWPALGDMKEEEKNVEEDSNSDKAKKGSESWMDGRGARQDNEDCSSEITTGVALEDGGMGSLSRRYDAQTVENSRLREEVLRLETQIQHLGQQLKEAGCDPSFHETKLADVTNSLMTITQKLRRDGIDPEPFGFSGTLSKDMTAHNELIDERDRCISVIEGRHPARERLRSVHRERMGLAEAQLRYWEEKHDMAARRAREAESRAYEASAKILVPQKGASVASARVHKLEELVSSQLEFYWGVQPLLGSANDLRIEVRAIEAEVIQRLAVPSEARSKIKALLDETGQDSCDDVESQNALQQDLQELEGAGRMDLKRKWHALRMASWRLRRFVEDARERLQEDALRIGIKGPEYQTTRAEVFAASLDTYLCPVLDPLGHPHLFTAFLSFITPHLKSYRHLVAFLLAFLLCLMGIPPAHSPRLRACDALRVLWHAAILMLLQTYLAVRRERNLWLHGNSGLTTAYLHDLQDETLCMPWWWGVDPRFMAFGPGVQDIVRGLLPELRADDPFSV